MKKEDVKEKLKKEEIWIPILGLAGTIADYATTKICSRTPGLEAVNPLVNPIVEGFFAVGGPLIISAVGSGLNVSRSLKISFMLIPAALPLTIALRNAILIATENARQYPISEFPLLYG